MLLLFAPLRVETKVCLVIIIRESSNDVTEIMTEMSAPDAEEDESRPTGLYDATETGEPRRLEMLGL